MLTFNRCAFLAAVLSGSALFSAPAAACGGFFCNQSQPVNQAAEGIIFADNGDGTTTAVIQIQYQGPSKNFSWLLPISSVPKADSDIGVASNLALQRLQAATNPNYTLTTRIEGTCRQEDFNNSGFPGSASGGTTSTGGPVLGVGGGGVTVEASGVVGAFEWAVISLDQSLAEPADAAIAWLGQNQYDVPQGAAGLLGPYLEDGMYLLALKLTKGADSGSIRPIVLTYTGAEASIPVKLTAVAANDDMGVLTWLLGPSRAVPRNYLSLELNEARINWFNANSTYNSVVIEAANDAGGQGFVTEFAGSTDKLKSLVWTQSDAQAWTTIQSQVFGSFSEFFTQVYGQYGAWDGFWDATRAAVTLPADLAFEDFKLCPNCYAGQIQFKPASYLAELQKSVIDPVKLVQNLIDAHPSMTRLYTTLSAEEMTVDPIFTFNPDLDDVDNQHTAERVIECNPNLFQSEAPWRIELPQGGVIRGNASSAGTWPTALDSLPSNRRVVRTGASGAGKVVEDNAAPIASMLDEYNASVVPTSAGTPGSGGSSSSNAASSSGGGCSVAAPNGSWSAFFAAFALGSALLRRRRRQG
jgi:MYXO-CTERM domain-containing protein